MRHVEYDGTTGAVLNDWDDGQPAPTPELDLAALVDQFAAMSETVDFLILSAAGDL